MKSISIRDLGGKALDIEQQLERDRYLLVKNDDKPVAVIFATDEEALAPCLQALARARGLAAVERMQRQSAAQGLDKMTMEEIDAIIAESRRERGLS